MGSWHCLRSADGCRCRHICCRVTWNFVKVIVKEYRPWISNECLRLYKRAFFTTRQNLISGCHGWESNLQIGGSQQHNTATKSPKQVTWKKQRKGQHHANWDLHPTKNCTRDIYYIKVLHADKLQSSILLFHQTLHGWKASFIKSGTHLCPHCKCIEVIAIKATSLNLSLQVMYRKPVQCHRKTWDDIMKRLLLLISIVFLIHRSQPADLDDKTGGAQLWPLNKCDKE